MIDERYRQFPGRWEKFPFYTCGGINCALSDLEPCASVINLHKGKNEELRPVRSSTKHKMGRDLYTHVLR